MERLTKINGKYVEYSNENYNDSVDNYTMLDKCLHKLADYENLEEQGLLLRLKAGVGSKVYDVYGNEYIVKHFTYYSYFEPHFEYEARNEEGTIWRFKDIHFGRFVFLTKEEAEQELAKRNGR